jgi:hypothetical protein
VYSNERSRGNILEDNSLRRMRGWLYEFRNFLAFESPSDALSLDLASE